MEVTSSDKWTGIGWWNGGGGVNVVSEGERERVSSAVWMQAYRVVRWRGRYGLFEIPTTRRRLSPRSRSCK